MAKVRFFLFGRAGAASPPFTHFAANYPIPSPDPFPRAANKKTAPTSNCTIPFGNPPLSKTPRISDTHHLNEKVTRKPAKRNLQPARAGRNEISATRKDRYKRKRDIPASASPGETEIPFCSPVLTGQCLP